MIEEQAQIAGLLPDALAKAVISYRLFAQKETFENSKDFAAYHAACKAAASHIELLLKLARQVSSGKNAENDQAMLAAMMALAEEEVTRYRESQAC